MLPANPTTLVPSAARSPRVWRACTPHCRYVDEDLLERRNIARARMDEIVEKVVNPIVGAYRHLMRLVRARVLLGAT